MTAVRPREWSPEAVEVAVNDAVQCKWFLLFWWARWHGLGLDDVRAADRRWYGQLVLGREPLMRVDGCAHVPVVVEP